MSTANEREVAKALSSARALYKGAQRLARETSTLAEGAVLFDGKQAVTLNRATRKLYEAVGALESAGAELAEAQKLLGP